MSGFRVHNRLRQITINQGGVAANAADAAANLTAISVADRPYLTAENFNNNVPSQGNEIDSINSALSSVGIYPPINPGRAISFQNQTAGTDLDLYLTEGGTSPKPLTKIATLTAGGAPFVWPISDTKYNFSGNFTTMPAGAAPPTYNAGPTLVEFGLNQVWTGSVPPLRDTFDISTVPPGIGTGVNDGPRGAATAASQAAGFSVQQSYNYNVGAQIVPPNVAPLPTQTVTCVETDGDCAQSIGFPNDTAFPKQQTGQAIGNYAVNFLDPVVSLP